MLHSVSFGAMKIYKVDLTSESLLYSKTILTGEPYTIHAYDAETIKSEHGKTKNKQDFMSINENIGSARHRKQDFCLA